MDPEDQKMHEISYKDVITAYGVNAFVPFVLIRELLPLMRSSVRSYKPTDYIIYLSACEGQPENLPAHKRAGYHVHTNMHGEGGVQHARRNGNRSGMAGVENRHEFC